MIKRVFICICICFGSLNLGLSQLTYRFDLGIGGSPYSEHFIAKTVNGSIGYCFFEELTVFGGINVFTQTSQFIFSDSDGDYDYREENKTMGVTSFLLQAGVHHSLTLKTFTKDRSQWEFKRIGVFPEVNVYFNPYLKRKYTDGIDDYKGDYASQFAYGLGGGILYGSWKSYIALKYECNSIDNLASISKLVSGLERRDRFNHVVSLVFVFR